MRFFNLFIIHVILITLNKVLASYENLVLLSGQFVYIKKIRIKNRLFFYKVIFVDF